MTDSADIIIQAAALLGTSPDALEKELALHRADMARRIASAANPVPIKQAAGAYGKAIKYGKHIDLRLGSASANFFHEGADQEAEQDAAFARQHSAYWAEVERRAGRVQEWETSVRPATLENQVDGSPEYFAAALVVRLFDGLNRDAITDFTTGPVYKTALLVYQHYTGQSPENINEGCSMVRPVKAAVKQYRERSQAG